MSELREVRVVLLLTCTKCQGEGSYETEEDGICNCPRCENGWQAASVPVSVLLNSCRPNSTTADCYEEIAAHIRAQKPTGHSLLRHLADDLPQSALEKVRQQRPTLSESAQKRANNVGE